MKLMSRTASFMMAALMIVSMLFTTAFAFNSEELGWLGDNIVVRPDGTVALISKDNSMVEVNLYFTTNSNEAANGDEPIHVTNGIIYLRQGASENGLLNKLEYMQGSNNAEDEIDKIVNGLIVKPNTVAAMEMLSGFVPFVRIIVGILVTLFMLAMTLYTCFDIAYIAFPIVRNAMEDVKESGSKSVMTKKSSNGESNLRFVTQDAQVAVQLSTEDTSRSPWTIYFKRRVWSYIMLAIVMFILLTGNIGLIINIALSAVSGIMNVLASLT